jgi:rod shape-determining protein MreC
MKTLNAIALMLFVAAAVAVIFFLDTPTTRAIQSKVMGVFSPFIHASATVEDQTVKALVTDIDPKELQADNERLRLEVQKLNIINQRNEELISENAQLRDALSYKQRSPFKNLIASRVIKRSSATWWNTLIIDRGSLDGVGTDSPVVTNAGLVGKTGRVSPHMTELILLTDEACKVSSAIVGTREKGILSGERAGLELMPDLRLRFLSRNSVIPVDAEVLSSGDGGVFPPGLRLGTVKRFENREVSGEAVVRPAVDFNHLEHVFVVSLPPEIMVAKPVQ